MWLKAKDREKVAEICPQWERAWYCRHCKDAPCVKVCPEDAFYEIAEGIWAIDPERCTGCGKCVDACPYGAIRIVDGTAKKCDLCLSVSDEPLCRSYVDIEYTEDEIDEMGMLIGWYVFKDGEYHVGFPIFTPFEARLAARVIEVYERLKGEYSWEEILEELAEDVGADEELKKRVFKILEVTYRKLGPLSLLSNEEIEEIAVIGLKQPIMVYIRGEGWLKTNLAFWTKEYFVSVVNRIAGGVGRRLTAKNPRVSAVLPDGSRLHAVVPPLAISGHALTIRKFLRRPFTPWDLIENGTVDARTLAKIWLIMEHEKNLVIAGTTGSGKTTTLNAVFCFVPLEERIIIVEETPEIRLPHPHVVRLVPNENVDMWELVRDSLRMRPDRVIVGEVRHPEEFRALFDTMLAGQGRGSYATMHGRSIEETRRRIISMGIPEEDLLALDFIAVQKRKKDGKREKRRLVALENPFGKPLHAVLELPEDVFEEEVKERARFLETLKEKDVKKYVEAVESWRLKRS